MDEARQRRIAANESRYRAVNESLKQGIDSFVGSDGLLGTYAFMCECALDDCDQMVDLTGDEYEFVRSEGTRFAVKPEHDIPETESVLVRNDRFWVVVKQRVGAAVAEEHDPRG